MQAAKGPMKLTGEIILILFLLLAFSRIETASAVEKQITESSGSLVLNIAFRGLKNSNGKVLVRIFSTEKGFPDEAKEALKVTTIEIQEGFATKAQFSGLAPGSYAISAIHDENGSGEMDTNWIGIPKEGLGVSQDVKGFMGPPKFSDSVIQMNQSLEIEINFVYL